MTNRGTWLALAGLIGAILLAYHNSLAGPFVFDDGPAIIGNPTIRHLSNLGAVLSPPREGGQTVGGRPIVNLSLAVNYALGGTDVGGYHAFNLAVHIACALVLFGVVRRTLLKSALRERFGSSATVLAFALALLWGVHPLLTESVTYVVQRAESLMGLFYLGTIYCFIRATESEPPTLRHLWLGLAVLVCALGMATKEVMVTAPLLVLLYDRTFVAGSWRGAWMARRGFYATLATTWLLLAWLVVGAQNRGGTAGLGLNDSVWTYAVTQTRAILLYLKLALWPSSQVFDYGTESLTRTTDALPYAAVLALAIVAAIWAVWRRPAIGFLGAWFFLVLAPSSSVVPIPVQPMAEHRMYLPLIAVVALVVLGLRALGTRVSGYLVGAVAVALVGLTIARNEVYATPGGIWADTLTKRAANARAHCYYGDALAAEGRFPAALAEYDIALRLDAAAERVERRSIRTDVLVNSGNVLRALGRPAEAVQRYEQALKVDPTLTAAHLNLGGIYLQADQFATAAAQFEAALKFDPNNAAAHASLGSALLLQGQTAAALTEYEAALRLDPSAKAHQDLGIALLYVHRTTDAIAHLEQSVRLQPDAVRAHEFLANALVAGGRPADAIEHYRRALQLAPDNERVRRALGALSSGAREDGGNFSRRD